MRAGLRHVAVAAAHCLIRLYLSAARINVVNEESLFRHIESGGKAVAAIWHERFFGVIGYAGKFKAFKPSAIISKSSDGDLIAKVAVRLGYRPIRGSNSRGGKEALAAIVKDLESNPLAIHAVDGPKGPRTVVKAGLIRMAQLSGAWIFPVYISVDRSWQLNSWDRFMIPKPFSKVLVHWDNPIPVPQRLTGSAFENVRLKVEARMIKGHAECDRQVAGRQ